MELSRIALRAWLKLHQSATSGKFKHTLSRFWTVPYDFKNMNPSFNMYRKQLDPQRCSSHCIDD